MRHGSALAIGVCLSLSRVGLIVAVLGTPATARGQEVIEYYGTDHLGSIRVVFDAGHQHRPSMNGTRMSSGRLGFELMLLERMLESYRASVLADVGLTRADFITLRSACVLKYPEECTSPLATFVDYLGPAAKTGPVHDASESFAGSTAYSFLLTLWPHLYWDVNLQPGEGQRPWGVGFQNQARVTLPEVEPAFIRPGIWTLSAVEALADDHELHDGWDEHIVMHLTFGRRRFEGTFVYNLLQDWREI